MHGPKNVKLNNQDVSPNLIKFPIVKFDETSASGSRVAPCGKKDEYYFEERVCVKSMKLHWQNTIRWHVLGPVVPYGGWNMEAVAECHTKDQLFWEEKIRWRIFRPAQMNGFWSTRRYEELNLLIKDTDMVTYMRVKTWNWTEHVVRILDNRNPKQIQERSLGGRGPVEKPRNRWDDEVRKVTAISVNTRNCRAAAGPICDWRKKTGKALGKKRVEEPQ